MCRYGLLLGFFRGENIAEGGVLCATAGVPPGQNTDNMTIPTKAMSLRMAASPFRRIPHYHLKSQWEYEHSLRSMQHEANKLVCDTK
jgi:hypothetical protein